MTAAVFGLATGAPAEPVDSPAADPAREAKEAELGAVRQRIDELRARVGQSRAVRDDLQEELRTVELLGAQLSAEMRQLDQALAAGKSRLAALAEDRRTRERGLAAQRTALARLVRADYARGHRDSLTVLLNQEEPSRVARVLTYHRYAERARGEQIRRVREEIAALGEVEAALAREQEALQSLQVEKAAAQQTLADQRQARATVLARLNDEIRASGAELDRLAEDARRLEKVIETLRNILPDIPDALGQSRRFAAMKGTLPWPTQGRFRHGFGAPRQGGLAWQGVVIAAPAGTSVQAVHHGRVAFADWLRGFGLLVIVDHGDGYMTLYGQNQSLLRQVGDWVEAGEPLATVGDTGGSSDTGLYFEIRQRGTPLNPAQWCKGTPSRG